MRDRSGRVVLMDFHAGSIAATPHAGDLVGTPMCLAPEILVDGRPASVQSDIYSAAVLAFRLLTAAYPVSAESLDGLRIAHRTRAPVSVRSTRPDVPERLAAALERGLARSPVDRPSSAKEFGSSLAESLDMGQERRVPLFWWAAAVTLVVTCASTVAIGVDSATRRPNGTGRTTASSAFGLTMSELDWKDFVPMSPPTSDGRRIAGWVTFAPAVRDLTSGEITDRAASGRRGRQRRTCGAVTGRPSDGVRLVHRAARWHRARRNQAGRDRLGHIARDRRSAAPDRRQHRRVDARRARPRGGHRRERRSTDAGHHRSADGRHHPLARVSLWCAVGGIPVSRRGDGRVR